MCEVADPSISTIMICFLVLTHYKLMLTPVGYPVDISNTIASEVTGGTKNLQIIIIEKIRIISNSLAAWDVLSGVGRS